jgi:hypothetical protein
MYDPKKVLDVKHYEHCIVSKPLYDEGHAEGYEAGLEGGTDDE